MADKLHLPGDGSVKDALDRAHSAEGEGWVAISYSNKNTLMFVAEGEGSLAEARQHFTPKEACFVLLRKQHKIDMAKTTKFAFVAWIPDSAKPLRKSILTCHKNQAKDFFLPFHVNLDCADDRDVDEGEAEIMNKIGFSSGTKMHVTDKEAYTAKPTSTGGGNIMPTGVAHISSHVDQPKKPKRMSHFEKRSPPSTEAKSKPLKFVDQEAFDAAYKAVKFDTDPMDWLLLGYEDIKTLKVLGSGSGGVEELKSMLDGEQAYYAYFRVMEKYDKTNRVRFCFLKVMSNKVSPLKRAKMTAHTGFLTEILSPAHQVYDLMDYTEFGEELVRQKLNICF